MKRFKLSSDIILKGGVLIQLDKIIYTDPISKGYLQLTNKNLPENYLREPHHRFGNLVDDRFTKIILGLAHHINYEGDSLPPVSLKQVGDNYEIMDGQHRILAHLVFYLDSPPIEANIV
jgi:hypothetical protein